MAYYTKYPNIKVRQTFNMIKDNYFADIALPRAIKDICKFKGNLRPYIERLPLRYKEMFLEDAMRAEVLRARGRQFSPDEIDITSRILLYFESSIRRVEGSNIILSTLLYTRLGILRCLDTSGDSTNLHSLVWKDCSNEEEEQYLEGKIAARQELEKEPFYGQIHPTQRERFCIRDCRDGKCEETLGHKVTSGAQCGSYNRDELALIATFYTTMPVPPTDEAMEDVRNNKCTVPLKSTDKGSLPVTNGNIVISRQLQIPYQNKKDLQDFLLKLVEKVRAFKDGGVDNVEPKVAKTWFLKSSNDLVQHILNLPGKTNTKFTWDALKKGIRAMNLAQMQRMVYYGTKKKVVVCGFLCHWFGANNLLLIDNGCGESNKKKPTRSRNTTAKKSKKG